MRVHTGNHSRLLWTSFFPLFFLNLLILGSVLGKTRALRDDSRFLGKQSTVPVQLVYQSTDNGHTARDVLSTRVRASPGPDQVSCHH